MKRTFSMLLCALVTLVTYAAEWQKPTVPQLSAVSTFVPSEEKGSGATYYLWNEEYGAFLGEGNDWNVRTTMNPEKGLEFYFSKYKINDVWQEGNYYFNTYTVANQSGRWDWMWIPIDNELIGYTDYKEPGQNRQYGSDFPLWNYEVNGNYLRILTGSLQPIWNEDTQGRKYYLGKPRTGEGAEEGNTIIYPNCTTDDNIDWRVVSKTDYEAFRTQLATYYAAMDLKDAIEASKDKYTGIDLSEVEAVYNNTASTKEALEAAKERIKDLEKDFVSNAINNATADNPYDATAYIVNPNYDGNVNGWTGITTSWVNTVAEYWSDNTNPFDAYQVINGLPNGVYEIKVYSLHRIGDYDWDHYKTGKLADDAQYRRTSQVYANDYWKLNYDLTDYAGTEPLPNNDYKVVNGYYLPNGQPYTNIAFNEKHLYEHTLFATVSDGTLRIGIRCNPREQKSWTSFDTWRLKYYGASAEALALLKTSLLDNIKDYSSDLVQATLKQQQADAIQRFQNATTYAEVEAAYNEAMNLFYDMEKSRNAYNRFVALAEDILPQTEDLNCEENDELLEFLEGEDEGTYGYIVANTPLTVEELAEKEEWMRNMLDAAIKNTVEEGKDYTNLIKNADWSQKDLVASGWTLDNWRGQTIVGLEGPALYHTAEIWNYKTFDLYQTLTDMPKGIYEITLPAVYRNRDNNYTRAASCELYVNGLAKDVMKATEDAVTNETAVTAPNGYLNWETLEGYNCYNINTTAWDGPWPNDFMVDVDGVTMYWPGSTGGASVAFNAGRYINKVYGLVGDDGILRFGVRSKGQIDRDNDWCCLGRISMLYMGENIDAIEGLKEEAIAQADIYKNSEEIYHSGYRDQINQLVLEVEKATTEAEITLALNNLTALFNTIDTSIGLYKKFINILSAEGTGYYATAAREGNMEAMEKAEGYMEGYNEGSYDNQAIQDLIDQINNDPLIDIIYIRGGLMGYEGDNWDSYEYPMHRQPDGTYKGTAVFRDERHGNINKYAGNRSLVVFHRLGQDICAKNNSERFLNESTAPRELKINDNTSWFLTWGGEWEFTIDLEAATMTCKPVGEMLYKNQIYAVGNLRDNNWQLSASCANHYEFVHQGNGIYQGSIAFNDGVDRGEVTLFASDMWLTNNWGEGRIGCVDDQVPLESGQEVACDRFNGDRKWILAPGHHYLGTYDLTRGTVRFDQRDLPGDDTAESPLLIADFEDLMMVRSYLRQGETHYFALTADINMTGKGWSQLNGPGEQNGRENQRWIDFDGRGHIIKGFGGDTGLQSQFNASFFGTLGGSVRNLGFVEANFTEDETLLADYGAANAQSIAVIAGALGSSTYTKTAEISQCFVTGNVTGGRLYAGALVGTINGAAEITNCYAQVNLTSDADFAAGLIGRVNGAMNLQNVYVAGSMSNNTPVIADYTTSAPACTLNNVVNWTTYNFDGARSSDTASGLYDLNDTNHATLQQTVVNFDPTIWSCTMQEGEYPILSQFAEVLDGIGELKGEGSRMKNEAIYDLSGRRVEKATKGIYITNGRVVVIK